MKYIKSQKYNMFMDMIMGPNPIKLLEELMTQNKTPKGSFVMDLGSGQGLTSIFLVKEYGFKVIAADLWSDPTEVEKFFSSVGLSENEIKAVHADAENLKFNGESFDAVYSIDSYHYFGRDESFLDEKLLPFVKRGGYIYIAIPGMKKDCHDNPPEELLLSWSPEQLAYIRDINYWKKVFSASVDSDIVFLSEMESNEEVWADWLKCDNEYAAGDRKSMEAGGGQYLNFIAAVLRKK